jgi:hypothetical protein
MGLFALFTWGTNVYTIAVEGEKEAAKARIDRVNFVFQCVSIARFSVPAGFAPVALGAKRFAFGRTRGFSSILAFSK